MCLSRISETPLKFWFGLICVCISKFESLYGILLTRNANKNAYQHCVAPHLNEFVVAQKINN